MRSRIATYWQRREQARKERRTAIVEDQRQAERERNEAETEGHVNEITAAIHRVEQALDRSSDENTPQKRRDRRWQIGSVVGLWAAALVGVAAILVGNHDSAQLYKAATGQQNVMKGQMEEMEIASRPWVTADVAIVRQLIAENGSIDFSMQVTLRNTGQTPATVTEVGWNAFPRELVPDPRVETKRICDQRGSYFERNMAVGPAVFPGDRKSTVYIFTINKDKLSEYYSRFPQNLQIVFPMAVICIAYIGYKDRPIHHTSFVFELTTAKGIRAADMPIPASDVMLWTDPVGALPPD